MLKWLKRYRETALTPAPIEPGGPRFRVSFDETGVELTKPDHTVSTVLWAKLSNVGIITTADGPLAPDLFWLLQEHDRRINLVIPMGSDGEHELLHEMQLRLPGFDNMTVIEAMSSIDPAGFVVWQLPETAESTT